MIDMAGLATAGLTFFFVAASPGPATLAVTSVSLSGGRSRGLKFGAGLSLGLAVWGLIAATGLGAILQSSSYALTGLKLLGGLYLLWLACKSLRASAKAGTSPEPVTGNDRWFLRGLLLNLSNPKAVVAWMAVLALGMSSETGGAQVLAATVLCSGLGAIIYAVYALVFSTARAMAIHERCRRWVDGVVGVLFAVAGFNLIRSALVRQV